MRKILLGFLLIVFVTFGIHLTDGWAQTLPESGSLSSRPVVGGPAAIKPKIILGSQDLETMRHRGPTGKPCLDVQGFARPLSPSSKLLDHVIMAENSCSDLIRVQVCYYKTTRCIPLEVPGHKRKEAILGGVVGSSDFSYEFRERF